MYITNVIGFDFLNNHYAAYDVKLQKESDMNRLFKDISSTNAQFKEAEPDSDE